MRFSEISLDKRVRRARVESAQRWKGAPAAVELDGAATAATAAGAARFTSRRNQRQLGHRRRCRRRHLKAKVGQRVRVKRW